MSNRLPTPGGDNGQWGQILNDFLSVEHNTDGSLKKAAEIAGKYEKPTGGIPAGDLSTSVQASLVKAENSVQSVNAVFPVSGNVTLAASDIDALPDAPNTIQTSHIADASVTEAKLSFQAVTQSEFDALANHVTEERNWSNTTTPVAYGQTHTYAAAQPTAIGKLLSNPVVLGGRLYAGYGDYETNTGPIWVSSVDATNPTGAWTYHIQASAEEIRRPRLLSDGRILVPHIDPRGSGGGYAERQVNGTWVDRPQQIDTSRINHVFDIIEGPGGRLFACGSASTYTTGNGGATIWESTNGGTTWSYSYQIHSSQTLSRFYSLARVGNEIFTYDPTATWGTNQWHKWTQGSGWAPATGFTCTPLNAGARPGFAFDSGWIIPMYDWYGYGQLLYVTASGATKFPDTSIMAVSADVGDDGALYVLTTRGIIMKFATANSTGEIVAANIDSENTWYDFDYSKGYHIGVLPGSQHIALSVSSRLAIVDLTTSNKLLPRGMALSQKCGGNIIALQCVHPKASGQLIIIPDYVNGIMRFSGEIFFVGPIDLSYGNPIFTGLPIYRFGFPQPSMRGTGENYDTGVTDVPFSLYFGYENTTFDELYINDSHNLNALPAGESYLIKIEGSYFI